MAVNKSREEAESSQNLEKMRRINKNFVKLRVAYLKDSLYDSISDSTSEATVNDNTTENFDESTRPEDDCNHCREELNRCRNKLEHCYDELDQCHEQLNYCHHELKHCHEYIANGYRDLRRFHEFVSIIFCVVSGVCGIMHLHGLMSVMFTSIEWLYVFQDIGIIIFSVITAYLLHLDYRRHFIGCLVSTSYTLIFAGITFSLQQDFLMKISLISSCILLLVLFAMKCS
ncbi:hypothetical protein Ahia01_000613300 [Argonauta hians]